MVVYVDQAARRFSPEQRSAYSPVEPGVSISTRVAEQIVFRLGKVTPSLPTGVVVEAFVPRSWHPRLLAGTGEQLVVH
jgi:hypothetical protein